jgi:hypothetical protein
MDTSDPSSRITPEQRSRMTPQETFDVDLAWRDLVIAGPQARIDQLLVEIERTLPPDWGRNHTAEQQSQQAANRRGWSVLPGLCYSRKLATYDVWLWLLRMSTLRIHGGVVEPTAGVRYHEDIAEAICDFRQRVLDPAVRVCGLKVSRNRLGPLSWDPGNTIESLWRFYDSSDFKWPPTGDAMRRWREFVVSAYQSHAALDRNELSAWLRDKGWNDADADALVTRLYADASLLSEYDELRQPV